MKNRDDVDERSEITHIDMVPMVDCIMVLVIFLMISSAFSMDPGIEVERPDVRGAPVNEQSSLPIAITSDNRVYFDGRQVRPEDLGALLQNAAVGRQTSVIIRADRRCSHGLFADVYATAKQVGIQHVVFATARSAGP